MLVTIAKVFSVKVMKRVIGSLWDRRDQRYELMKVAIEVVNWEDTDLITSLWNDLSPYYNSQEWVELLYAADKSVLLSTKQFVENKYCGWAIDYPGSTLNLAKNLDVFKNIKVMAERGETKEAENLLSDLLQKIDESRRKERKDYERKRKKKEEKKERKDYESKRKKKEQEKDVKQMYQ
jgi:hypothetical protein